MRNFHELHLDDFLRPEVFLTKPAELALFHALKQMDLAPQATSESVAAELAAQVAKDPQAKPLGAILALVFGHRGPTDAAPKISTLISLAAGADAFGLAGFGQQPTNRNFGLDCADAFDALAMAQVDGGVRNLASLAALALATGPCSREIGLALNQANPIAAARWPWVAAMAGASPQLLDQLVSQAPPPLARDADAAWLLASATRDRTLLEFARRAGAPSEKVAIHCADFLSPIEPSQDAREACRLGDREPIPREEMARAALDALPSPALAGAMLRSACLDQRCVPHALPRPWLDLLNNAGASLSQHDAFDIFEQISLRRNRVFNLAQSEPGAQWDKRSAELEQAELDAAKLALALPLAPHHFHPPAAIRALRALPWVAPAAARDLEAALDRWAQEGFGQYALQWRGSDRERPDSLGEAVAGLPRTKNASVHFGSQAQRWTRALAEQGFDFEAKARPKAKSLADRFRSMPTLREFWPLVEAAALSMQAKPAPKGSRPGL